MYVQQPAKDYTNWFFIISNHWLIQCHYKTTILQPYIELFTSNNGTNTCPKSAIKAV